MSMANREVQDAAWQLIGCLEWSLDHGMFDGVRKHLVASIREYIRRIDERAGHGSRRGPFGGDGRGA